jgi:hypothetical protein
MYKHTSTNIIYQNVLLMRCVQRATDDIEILNSALLFGYEDECGSRFAQGWHYVYVRLLVSRDLGPLLP